MQYIDGATGNSAKQKTNKEILGCNGFFQYIFNQQLTMMSLVPKGDHEVAAKLNLMSFTGQQCKVFVVEIQCGMSFG